MSASFLVEIHAKSRIPEAGIFACRSYVLGNRRVINTSSDDSIVMLIVAPFRRTMTLLGLARQRCDVSIDLSPKWFRGSDTHWCRVGQVGTRCFGPLNAYFLSVFRLYNCQTLHGFDAINSLSTHKWWFFVEHLYNFLFMMQLSRNVP